MDPTPVKFPDKNYSISKENVTSVTVFGEESGIYFTMSKSNISPNCNGSNIMTLTDNSGNNYNKMYLRFAYDCPVSAGDVWNATTTYKIEWK